MAISSSVLLSLFILLPPIIPNSLAQSNSNISLGSCLTPIGDNTTWRSPSGDFAFGFRPLDTDPNLFLLAIWFDKIPNKTTVWYLGGGTQPVQSGDKLQLVSNGYLSLEDQTGQQIWTSGTGSTADYAAMLDTGNFVLASSDGSISWQSFDNPSDTILPSQVLSQGSMLRARLMDTDYMPGRFILSVQQDGNLVFYPIVQPSGFSYDPYWASHTVGIGTKLVYNETGSIYLALANGNDFPVVSAGSYSLSMFYQRATLDPDGVLRQYVYPKNSTNGGWSAVDLQPLDICQAMFTETGSGVCGFNSYCKLNGNQSVDCECPPHYSYLDPSRKYRGCKPNFAVHNCHAEGTEVDQGLFDTVELKNVDWPLADYEHYQPLNNELCRNNCLSDCFCAVVVYNDQDCWKKKLPLSNGRVGSYVQRTLLVKIPKGNYSQIQPATLMPANKKNDKRTLILVGSVLLGSSAFFNLLLIAAIIFITFYGFRIRRNAKLGPDLSTVGLSLRCFTYRELEKATNGFREEVGSGASGVVYKGYLQDKYDTCIAVKKIGKALPETEKEFAVEMQAIGKTHHKNLVRLLGYCNEGKERLLVYEFMSNRSLTQFLFNGPRPDWNRRVQIALGVARGLLYLHEECSTRIIHCDIKPQNILLDENFVAKISDFGLAKLLKTDQTQTNTGIRGTRGYVAPEWFRNVRITSKVDVYSFGVILLEIICCRRNVEAEIGDEEQVILTYWVNDCYREGRVDLAVDGDEEATADMKRVEQFVMVALWCVQEEPSLRPTMRKVTQMLEGAVDVPMPPEPSLTSGTSCR
ncbi:G-type lectin S-receptor-like serine/threonine-protein kinase LECRK1 [Ananas comosus]|uniref:Receptor-like serine/threonine-protein kinase n=1 Tax=Ananas comosus TaxID=4615 RepID=A0A6P5GR01_ANACO|nr:G-type lectin S-receptor-like serine/threonine-protein kinase LECRK1 [Ananas comosus]